MANAPTLGTMSPKLSKVVWRAIATISPDQESGKCSHETNQRRSRMVEISKSGSGEGPGKVTTRGYSTIELLAIEISSIPRACEIHKVSRAGHELARAPKLQDHAIASQTGLNRTVPSYVEPTSRSGFQRTPSQPGSLRQPGGAVHSRSSQITRLRLC